jgi:hypothetical protein
MEVSMNLAARISTFILPSIAGLLIGCGSGAPTGPSATLTTTTTPTTPTPINAPLASGGATNIDLVECNGSLVYSILQFITSGSGSISPINTVSLPTNFVAEALATDTSGQIYVGGYQPSTAYQILVYTSGSSAPSRTIVASNVGTLDHSAIAVDASGSIYVAGYDTTGGPTSPGNPQIAVYSSTANGPSTPVRLITGSLTQLTIPTDIAVDAGGNIYVDNDTSILIFPSTVSGNTPFASVLTATNTVFYGIALDTSGNIYTDAISTITDNWSIQEFRAGAFGASTPIKTITSSALVYGGGIRVDSAGNIFVINRTFVSPGVTTATNVLGFGPTATGNTNPAINFTSNAWPVGVYNYVSSYGGFELALK